MYFEYKSVNIYLKKKKNTGRSLNILHDTLLQVSLVVVVVSQFNGTSTPKGPHSAKTGDNDCNVNSSRYSLSTALCESNSLPGKVWTKCPTRPDTQGRHVEAALMNPASLLGAINSLASSLNTNTILCVVEWYLSSAGSKLYFDAASRMIFSQRLDALIL